MGLVTEMGGIIFSAAPSLLRQGENLSTAYWRKCRADTGNGRDWDRGLVPTLGRVKL